MVEAFLLSVGEEPDGYALTTGLNKINEWYLSDGWYSDGAEFSLDYYNYFVIHPMYVEILETCSKNRFPTPVFYTHIDVYKRQNIRCMWLRYMKRAGKAWRK